MNKRSLLAIGVLFFSLGLVVSCSNNLSYVKRYTTTLSFSPLIDTTYYFKATQWTQTIQKMQRDEMTTGNQISYEIAYTPLVDSAGAYKVDARFTDFRMATYVNTDTIELNTKQAARSPQPTDRMFSVLINSPFVLTVDSSGFIHSVAGIEGLNSRMEKLSNESPDALELYRSSVKNVINDAFIKQTMATLANTFSHRPLTTAAEWNDSTAVPGMEGLKMHSTYTVKRMDSSEVEINCFSDIKITDQPITIEGQLITASLEGEQQTSMVLETQTSLIKQSQTKFRMSGEINVMATQVPIEIVSGSSVNIKY